MMGYGPEDSNFVLGVLYNYGDSQYTHSNDLGYLKIKSRAAYAALTERRLGGQEVDLRTIELRSPGEGYTFRVVGEDPDPAVGELASLCLNVTELERSLEFWSHGLGLLEVDRGDDFATLSCGADCATVRLHQLPHHERLVRGTAHGRVAFSCPAADLEGLQDAVRAEGHTVAAPLALMPTPGKASVPILILADPDGHEVCVVGDEAFRGASQRDDDAPQKLAEALAAETGRDWLPGEKHPS